MLKLVYNDLLIKSKEKISKEYYKKCEEKLEEETKKMKEQLENQFRDDFDNLNSKSVKQEAQLEDLNRNITNLKEEINTCNDQVEELKKENINKEAELERVKEEIKSIYAPFFDLYHTKTAINILILFKNAIYFKHLHPFIFII